MLPHRNDLHPSFAPVRFGRATLKPFAEELSTLSVSPKGRHRVTVEDPWSASVLLGSSANDPSFRASVKLLNTRSRLIYHTKRKIAAPTKNPTANAMSRRMMEAVRIRWAILLPS